MPSEIRVTGFPIPPDVQDPVEHKLESTSKKHRQMLALGINKVAQAAFSPVTTISSLSGDTNITATTDTTLASLTQTITTPIPARLWYDLTVRAECDVAAANSILLVVVYYNGVNMSAGIRWYTQTAGDLITLTSVGPIGTTMNTEPGTLYTVEVKARLVGAGATYILFATNTVLRLRVEPRLL